MGRGGRKREEKGKTRSKRKKRKKKSFYVAEWVPGKLIKWTDRNNGRWEDWSRRPLEIDKRTLYVDTRKSLYVADVDNRRVGAWCLVPGFSKIESTKVENEILNAHLVVPCVRIFCFF